MYHVYISKHFKRQIKGLVKKYPNLKTDIRATLKEFKKEQCISLGAHTYKLRIGLKSAGRGKSAALRIIILLIEVDSIIAPLTLYAKSDRANIPRQEIMYHIALVRQEIQETSEK